ncbi:MAG: NUDIX domain-containing protein [Bacteroidales bacterium]|nr:NUDIX domain-containing protein [Bacteroidales bacterium]
MDLVYPGGPVLLYPRPSADHPGPFPLPKGEMLPIVEPTGVVYGKCPRDWCHSGAKPLHPVVHLHIIDRDGCIYLQKRSVVKDLYPGYWDTAVGGHVSFGETAEEALYREAEEELCLTAFNPVQLGTYVWETETEKELVFLYAYVGHPDLTPNGLEVSKGRWYTVQGIEESLGKDRLTPCLEHEFSVWKEKLLAML